MATIWKCLVLVAMVTVISASKCKMPPSHWCSTKETAENCGVLEQCTRSLTPSMSAEPVNFTLYFESLCPDCQRFFIKQLYHTYMALGEDVMNLTLVPYGNAREKQGPSGRWEFECQHGKEECVGNLIETCAYVLEKNKTATFLFIHCMEKSDDLPQQSAKKCAPEFKIDLDKVMMCANGDMGNQLEHKMAEQTNALDPPHKYVPWVTLNGVHTEKIEREAEDDLMSLICHTYTGPKPEACKKHEWKKITENKCLRIYGD